MTCIQTALFLAKQALTMHKVVAFLSTYCSNITYWAYAPYDDPSERIPAGLKYDGDASWSGWSGAAQCGMQDSLTSLTRNGPELNMGDFQY